MNILITGASGFVGSHLCKYLSEFEGVVAMLHDKLVWNSWQMEALGDVTVVEGDIRNFNFLKRVLNQYDITDVFHLAAQSIVKRAWKDPVNTFDVNTIGTLNLLEACRQLDVERIQIQSSDKVYGNCSDADIYSCLKPTEPYSASKICTDIIAQTYMKTYGMNVIITRPCNIFGYDWNNRIIPNTIKSCLNGEKPVIYEDDDSERQYVYIDDVLDVFWHLMFDNGKPGIYNVGAYISLNQEQVVEAILKFFPELIPRYVKKPKLKQIHSQFMKEFLQAENPTSFKDGIEKTIQAFKRYE